MKEIWGLILRLTENYRRHLSYKNLLYISLNFWFTVNKWKIGFLR